jgi:dihydroflavonol-4-reductase
MKVLVTGGTGFVGNHLLEALLEAADTDIFALVRNPARGGRLGGRIHVLEGDLANVPSLPAGLSVVYHLAGLTKTFRRSQYYTVNQAGTASLFRALAAGPDSPVIVHASSLAAGGPSDGRPRREDDPARPVSPYGRSKLAAEEEALRYRDRFPVVILRLGAVYGPGDEDFLDYFRWVKKGVVPLFGKGPKPLSLCYVRDAVRAMRAAAGDADPSGQVFNIAAPSPATWEEIGAVAAGILGRRFVRVRVPNWAAFLACSLAEAAARVRRRATALNLSKYADMKPEGWVADVGKARAGLGFETRWTLEAGLRETLAWYARHGLL